MSTTRLQGALRTLFIWLGRENSEYLATEWASVWDFDQEVGCSIEELFLNPPISKEQASQKFTEAEEHVLTAISAYPELSFGWKLMFHKDAENRWFIGLTGGNLAFESLEAEHYDLLRRYTTSTYEEAEASASILEKELEEFEEGTGPSQLFDKVLDLLQP